MNIHEAINIVETLTSPVPYEQVVTDEWIDEVLDYGFDVGVPHPNASIGADERHDRESVMRMLEALQDDGVIPDEVDISHPTNAKPYVTEWFKHRFRFVLENLNPKAVDGGYLIERSIYVTPEQAQSLATTGSLGEFWSFANGQMFWHDQGSKGRSELIMRAVVAPSDIDWITTIRRNMNYVIGEEELEVFLPAGTPLRLVGLTFKGASIPVSNAQRTA
jgi:hypothetical protein